METASYEMPFGRFRGRQVGTLPSKYLSWVVENVKKKSAPAAEAVTAAAIELRRRGVGIKAA